MTDTDQPKWAEPSGLTDGELRRRYEAHVARLGWKEPPPGWNELSDYERDLWAAIVDLKTEDIAEVFRNVLNERA